MKRALISVTDKTGVVEFARGLLGLGYEILSTGGTAKTLVAAGVPVVEVATASGSPEIFDGRVKTLHPKIHGGILFERDNPTHRAQAAEHGITPIDIVAVNLYDFAGEAVAHGLAAEDAIHHIDVGGPAMLRAAAKNYAHCVVVPTAGDYDTVIRYLKSGGLELSFRRELARKTFALVSQYDGMVARYLGQSKEATDLSETTQGLAVAQSACGNAVPALPLRYGENPHQRATFTAPSGALPFTQLQGKELSYNNLLDVDAAWQLATECAALLKAPAIAIIKHSSPCGVAVSRSASESLLSVFERSLLCDRRSAFGGIVASSSIVDAATAEAMAGIFLECIAAPGFSPEALAALSGKKNLRLLRMDLRGSTGRGKEAEVNHDTSWNVRSCLGGYLWQTTDLSFAPTADWKQVAGGGVDGGILSDLILAQVVAKHARSNAVAFVREGATMAIGCGQTSRIDAADFALRRAEQIHGRDKVTGMVMGSDAFFPFRDCVELAAAYGVRAIVQPGGSQRDQESIAAAEEHGISLFMSGMRHFRH